MSELLYELVRLAERIDRLGPGAARRIVFRVDPEEWDTLAKEFGEEDGPVVAMSVLGTRVVRDP